LNSLLFTNIVINKSVYICKESSLKASLVAQYVINLTEFNDRTLKTAMNDVPENSVILFEDIDCMKAGNRRPDSNEWIEDQPSSIATEKANPAAGFAVTLSGLLNVLDGFHAPENVVYVMTTNRVEALDPALLRPGRIDYRLFMGDASESQGIELYCRFFPEATEPEAREFVQAHCAETMAEFQGLLLALEQGWELLEPVSAELEKVGTSR
jgi:chaperone BCS1